MVDDCPQHLKGREKVTTTLKREGEWKEGSPTHPLKGRDVATTNPRKPHLSFEGKWDSHLEGDGREKATTTL